MEMESIIRHICGLALFTAMACIISCDYLRYVDCEECYTEAPSDVIIDITLSNQYISQCSTKPIISIYDGDYKDNILVDSFTADEDTSSPYLLIERKYTFTATYIIDGETYITFDSVTPKIKQTSSDCDDTCFYIYDTKVNLSLKYIK